ncbi:MAG: hypothetical protein HQK50_13315 [Oligoflexia bacterium]|nr:hypothetical protein [Oligoflexia bacterium]MBF0366546.1 hypothetical protein [Oligoflexia bacterium]
MNLVKIVFCLEDKQDLALLRTKFNTNEKFIFEYIINIEDLDKIIQAGEVSLIIFNYGEQTLELGRQIKEKLSEVLCFYIFPQDVELDTLLKLQLSYKNFDGPIIRPLNVSLLGKIFYDLFVIKNVDPFTEAEASSYDTPPAKEAQKESKEIAFSKEDEEGAKEIAIEQQSYDKFNTKEFMELAEFKRECAQEKALADLLSEGEEQEKKLYEEILAKEEAEKRKIIKKK